MSDPLLRPEEVAERLACSRRMVYGMARSGQLPSVAIGALLRFRPEDVDALIESGLRASGSRPPAIRPGGRRLQFTVPRSRS